MGPSLWGIPMSTTLANLFNNHHWRLPPARSNQQQLILQHLSTITLHPNALDLPIWTIDGTSSSTFSACKLWQHHRPQHPPFQFASLVWIKDGLPRNKILTWLITLDRCPTRDRLSRWGIPTPVSCLLCNNEPESRNHLFFSCMFSKYLWKEILRRTGHDRFQTRASTWSQSTRLLLNTNRGSIRGKLLLIAWQTALYQIWGERNRRLHTCTFASDTQVFTQIDHSIRNQISSLQETRPKDVSELLSLWFSI